MIINKYVGKLEIERSFLNLDLYICQKGIQAAKRCVPQELYDKCEKWITQKYLYRKTKKETEDYLKKYYDRGRLPLFSSVEIEIINRCNGICPFCPANRYQDPRKMKRMRTELFKKIIDELGAMNYSGRLALHSNNEPFLDNRIVEFAKYAREHVPHAYIYLFTNGTLVTLDRFRAIIPYLNKMVIDNYHDALKLHKNAESIHQLCKKNPSLNRKVEIHVRKVHEVLNTRGGQSPNNKKKRTFVMSCILPYKQMIIRPDGRTSLCCNDPYGKYTLSDLNKMTLKEAWYSERYEKVRRELRDGRERLRLCRFCDTMPDVNVY